MQAQGVAVRMTQIGRNDVARLLVIPMGHGRSRVRKLRQAHTRSKELSDDLSVTTRQIEFKSVVTLFRLQVHHANRRHTIRSRK